MMTSEEQYKKAIETFELMDYAAKMEEQRLVETARRRAIAKARLIKIFERVREQAFLEALAFMGDEF